MVRRLAPVLASRRPAKHNWVANATPRRPNLEMGGPLIRHCDPDWQSKAADREWWRMQREKLVAGALAAFYQKSRAPATSQM